MVKTKLFFVLCGALLAWGFGSQAGHNAESTPAAPSALNAPATMNTKGGLNANSDSSLAVEHLSRGIMNAISSRTLRGTTCGIKVYDLAMKKTIYAYHAATPLTPASTMKLLTSSAALSLYGPSYKIPTELRAESCTGGVVHGDLYIKGYGDPTFTIQDMDSLVDALYAKGVRTIEGGIVGDGTYYDDVYQRAQYSGDGETVESTPPIAALTLDRNVITVVATAGKPGEKARLQTVPRDPDIVLVNGTITAGAPARSNGARRAQAHTIRKKRHSYTSKGASEGTNPQVVFASYTTPVAYHRGSYIIHKHTGGARGRVRSALSFGVSRTKDGRSVITVSGRIGAGRAAARQIALGNPALAVAGILKGRLESEGISVTGDAATGAAPPAAHVLVKKETPLTSVLAQMNKASDNYYAEQVFKMIGARVCPTGAPECGLADTSVKCIRAFLDAASVNCDGCAFHDGSGLSHRARVTPDLIVGVLEKMHSEDSLFIPFYNTLGIAGVDGTVKHRMAGTPADSDAHTKTGTLNRVSALAGYVRTRDKDMWAFDITMNDTRVFAARKIQDQIVEMLASFSYNKNE